jgi:hypothetical protein
VKSFLYQQYRQKFFGDRVWKRSHVRSHSGGTLPDMRTTTSATDHTHQRLKEGINIYRTPIGLRCGTARSSFAIPENGYVRALEMLANQIEDGVDIAVECGITAAELSELLWNLEEHEFLETSPSILAITTRYQSVAKHKRRDILPDAAFSQLQRRVAPELAHTRLLPGVHDSGVSIINSRQNVRVEIYGSDRIATLLYGILLSSGVTYTHFAMGTRADSPAVVDTDLSAGFIRATDVGHGFKQRMEILGKELSLFPIESHENAQEIDEGVPERFIKIHTGPLDPQLLAQWMTSGHEHCVISPLDGGHLVFGPIVQPGKTPCTRCRDITITQSLGGVSAIANKIALSAQAEIQQPPVFAAHYLAGVIASFLLAHIDKGESELTGGYMAVDTLNLSQSSLIALGRNPECGCNWL